MENIAVIFFTFILISIISFVVKTLTTSSGSKLKGNSLDDFILKKDVTNVPLDSSTRHKYYEKFSKKRGIQIRIVFGTEYGASEDVAKTLYKK